MPSLHIVKEYKPYSFYHIYNRGVHRHEVFRQPKDYWRFRQITRDYLQSQFNIEVTAFSLLPNHFHLQIFQKQSRAICSLMQSLCQSYVIFFNKKYQTTGRLFESCYKARVLVDEKDISYNKQYILNNPIDAGYHSWQHAGLQI